MPAELVPQHHRERVGIQPLDEMQVGVAQPGKGRADQHLVRARLVDRDVLDDERLVHFVQNGGFHRALLRVSCRERLLCRRRSKQLGARGFAAVCHSRSGRRRLEGGSSLPRGFAEPAHDAGPLVGLASLPEAIDGDDGDLGFLVVASAGDWVAPIGSGAWSRLLRRSNKAELRSVPRSDGSSAEGSSGARDSLTTNVTVASGGSAGTRMGLPAQRPRRTLLRRAAFYAAVSPRSLPRSRMGLVQSFETVTRPARMLPDGDEDRRPPGQVVGVLLDGRRVFRATPAQHCGDIFGKVGGSFASSPPVAGSRAASAVPSWAALLARRASMAPLRCFHAW